MFRIFAVIAVLLAAAPARALDTNELGQGGSLLLTDLDKLIAQSPRLRREVNEALTENNKKAEDVLCTGNRFPSRWVALGGLRVAGRVYDRINRDAMKNAQEVAETKPLWKWTVEEPDKERK